MLDEMLDQFNKNSKKKKKKKVLDENLITTKFFIQHFQTHPTQFSRWIGLLLVPSNISFL